MRHAAFLALLIVATPAGARPIDYRCPPIYPADDGRTLVLVERSNGAWRVDEPVPFVLGQGRFWRLVCTYRDPRAVADGMEAMVYWAGDPHEDGRLILEDVCVDGDPDAGTWRSRRRQAKALSSGRGEAAARLAREMLAAAETVALPCPGAADAPRVCPRWEVEEIYVGGSRRLCTWEQVSSSPDDAYRYVYRSHCRLGGFLTAGEVRRTDEGRFERSFTMADHRTVRYVYDGEFENGERVSGRFHWISPEGDQGPEMDFEARCIDEGRRTR